MPRTHISGILLATDFSPSSMAAFPYAVAFAQRFRAKLYVVDVITETIYGTSWVDAGQPTLKDIRAHVEEQMSALRATMVLKGTAHEVLIGRGDMWPVLAAIVRNHSVDLLVVGSQGRRGIEKLLLGQPQKRFWSWQRNPC